MSAPFFRLFDLQRRYLITAALFHAALIVALILLVHPDWNIERRTPPVIRVALQEPQVQLVVDRDPPPREDVLPEEAPPLQEQRVAPPIPEPKTVLTEPAPIPPSALPPIPELLVRVKPLVVLPPPTIESKPETEQQREERLEPRVPQDYVDNLLDDPRNKKPNYPRIALRRNAEGELTVAVLVGLDGSAKKLEVLKPAGTRPEHAAMARSALKALATWHYRKVMFRGKPVEIWVHVPVRFELSDRPQRRL